MHGRDGLQCAPKQREDLLSTLAYSLLDRKRSKKQNLFILAVNNKEVSV
jgi:hypothetical protein